MYQEYLAIDSKYAEIIYGITVFPFLSLGRIGLGVTFKIFTARLGLPV